MPEPSEKAVSAMRQACEIYGRFLLEQQAQMYEMGSIFSVNDPELRALELEAARRIRERLIDGQADG